MAGGAPSKHAYLSLSRPSATLQIRRPEQKQLAFKRNAELRFALVCVSPAEHSENGVNIQTLWTKLLLIYSMFDFQNGVCHVGHSANSSGKANCFKLLSPFRPSSVGGCFLLSRLLVHAGRHRCPRRGSGNKAAFPRRSISSS